MTFVKLEDAIAAVENAITCGGLGVRAIEQLLCDDATKALRSLPTDDGWEENERREIVAWLRAEANERGKRDRNDYRNTAFVKSKAEQIILVLASKIERLEHK